jgi:uncharacterized protein (DUF1697 family)
MKGEKLREVFENLGFKNVRTVIASGNVVFDSPLKNMTMLEEKIERELPKRLKFISTTIIRSQKEIRALVKKNPFKGVEDKKPNYLVVTFFKDRRTELCTVINLVEGKTPDFMAKLERAHGKAMTTRTWKTVYRILEKMERGSEL